ALEHGGEGVEVTVGALAGGFYVEDDGEGIPADERDAVLNDGYTTAGGTGLGLSIVEHCADAHDWELVVAESAAGGARFEFGGVEFE
ncbi:MAG: sensor histidine kinase, partial [Halanaeroarchaeum sp.]